MTRWAERLKKTLLLNPWLKWVALPVAALTLIGTGMSQSTFTTPQVALASTPLYAQGARAKPALMLALSVEFPTVGAQYLGTQGSASDATYAATTQYLGYFDSEGCYTYNDTPTEGAAATYARFDRSANATSHTCGGTGFSGNFMNWASSSAIDILRYGLTGGDRVVDTSSLTILQRAVLPNTNVSGNFWNGTNFPDKQISASVAATVLPSSMVASATGTIHIANCLNPDSFRVRCHRQLRKPGGQLGLRGRRQHDRSHHDLCWDPRQRRRFHELRVRERYLQLHRHQASGIRGREQLVVHERFERPGMQPGCVQQPGPSLWNGQSLLYPH